MTISFNDLGRAGRLGNQMFQYAALRGIAAHKGYHWIIPPADAPRPDNYGLHEAFKLTHCKPENIGEQRANQLSWREFHFNQDLFDNIPDGVDVDGYFQTERWFKHIEDEIREDFTFKDEILEPCKEYIDSLDAERLVFIHVRRGNPNLQGVRGERWSYQLLQDTHPLMKEEYYERGINEYFDDNTQFLVFSDVIDWCKEQKVFQGDRFLFSEASKQLFGDGASVPYVDLCLMTLCDGAIIANSSMSWWGAWLQNPDRTHMADCELVIAPQPWFGPKCDHYIMDDLYLEGWNIEYNPIYPVAPGEFE